MPLITPTVGRVLWMYHRNDGQIVLDSNQTQISMPPNGEPLMATICRVHPDGQVNVAGFDAEGKPYAERYVTILEADQVSPKGGRFACWMPFQISQALQTKMPAPMPPGVSEGA